MFTEIEKRISASVAREKKHAFFLKTRPVQEAVKAIERFTELDFGPHPKLVDSTPWNKGMLALNSLFDSWLRTEVRGLILVEGGGQYIPSYHLSIIDTQTTEGCPEIHEVAHALSCNINPFHFRLAQTRFGALKGILGKNPRVAEIKTTQIVLQEGFASWIEDGVTGARKEYREAYSNPVYRNKSFEVLQQIKEYRMAKAQGRDLPLQIDSLAAAYAPYIYGMYFVESVIDQLERTGYKRDKAITELLRFPLYNFDELEDPSQCAQKIKEKKGTIEPKSFDAIEFLAKLACGY